MTFLQGAWRARIGQQSSAVAVQQPRFAVRNQSAANSKIISDESFDMKCLDSATERVETETVRLSRRRTLLLAPPATLLAGLASTSHAEQQPAQDSVSTKDPKKQV
jgi:hypothetical protein